MSSKLRSKSNVADGATAIGHELDTANSLVTSGAKLLSILNNAVEKFYINKDGDLLGTQDSSTSMIIGRASGGGGGSFKSILLKDGSNGDFVFDGGGHLYYQQSGAFTSIDLGTGGTFFRATASSGAMIQASPLVLAANGGSGSFDCRVPIENTQAGILGGRVTVYDDLMVGSSNGLTNRVIYSNIADGATATGFTFGTTNALSTSGSKLLSITNNGVEKFAIDKDGVITVGSMSGSGSVDVQNNGVLVKAGATPLDFTSDFAVTNPSASKALIDLNNISLAASNVVAPLAHNTVDLGTTDTRFKDIYYAGTLYGGSSPMGFASKTPVNEGVGATGYVQVIDNGLTPSDWVQVGTSGHLIPGTHFAVGGTASITASNLATALNGLSLGLTATPSSNQVNLLANPGTSGNSIGLLSTLPVAAAVPPGPLGFDFVQWSPDLGIFTATAWDRTAWSNDGINWTTNYSSVGYTSINYKPAWSPALGIFCVMEYTTPGISWTSTDGKVWTQHTGLPHKSRGICWAPAPISKFVTVTGSNAANCAMYSSDGITFTNSTAFSISGGSWTYVCFGTPSPAIPGYPDGMFVAANIGSAQVALSADGITWTIKTTLQRGGPIVWSPTLNKFCMIYNQGSTQTNGIQMSADGTTWTGVNGPDVNGFSDLIWDSTNSQFVATRGGTGISHIYTSPDGTTWTPRTTGVSDGSWGSVALAPALGKLVEMNTGTNFPNVLTSTDAGVSWTNNGTGYQLPPNASWSEVIWAAGPNQFVAVASGRSAISADGISWTAYTPTLSPTCMAYSPALGKYIALGSSTTGWQSTDGITWTSFTGVPHGSTGICWSPEQAKFVAVNSTSTAANTAMTSTDGTTWTPCSVGVAGFYQNVQWSASRSLYIAGGSSSGTHVMISSDGSTWTSKTIPLTSAIDVAYSPTLDMFAAVMWDNAGAEGPRTGIVCTSTDGGNTWTNQPGGYPGGWQHIQWCSGLGMFIAVADFIKAGHETWHVMTSTDGVTWTPRSTPNAYYWKMAYSPTLNRAIAMSTNVPQNVVYSNDGATWAVAASSSSPKYSLSGATLTGGTDVAPTVFTLNSSLSQTLAGAKLLSVKNAGTEKFAVDKDGGIIVKSTINPAVHNTVDVGADATRFKDMYLAGTIYASNMNFTTTAPDTTPPGTPVGTITVTDNNLTDEDWVEVVGIPTSTTVLNPGVDFTVGATATDTAANLATAINNASIGVTANNNSSSSVTITSNYPGTWANRFRMHAERRVPLPTGFWNGVVWSPELGIFAACAGTGTYRIATSPDGRVWTKYAVPLLDWQSIAWGNGRFVVVGYGAYGGAGTVLTSTDGINWVQQSPPGSYGGWKSVAFGGGTFVAITPSADITYPYNTMNSSDGVTWTRHHAPNYIGKPGGSGGYSTWMDVAYGAGRFVAVADVGNYESIMISTDGGNSWTPSGFAEGGHWRAIAYGNGIFIAASDPNYGQHQVQSSPSGDVGTWTLLEPPEWGGSIGFVDVHYADSLGMWVLVSWNGPTYKIQTSTDNGATWTGRSAYWGEWRSVAWSPTKHYFIVVGSNFGSSMDSRSYDGITWRIPPGSKFTIGSTQYIDAYGNYWWHFAGGVDNGPAIRLGSVNEIKKDANRLLSVQNAGVELYNIRRGRDLGGIASTDVAITEFNDKTGILRMQISAPSSGAANIRSAEDGALSFAALDDYTQLAGFHGAVLDMSPAQLTAGGLTDARFGLTLDGTSVLGINASGVLGLAAGSVRSAVSNGASAIGFTLDTKNDFTTAGAKLLSVKNLGTEKFAIDKDGKVKIQGTQVLSTQQSAVADAAVVTTVGSNTGTSGAGLSLIGDTTTVDQSGAIMNDLVALQEDILDLRTKLNAALAALRAHGLIAP